MAHGRARIRHAERENSRYDRILVPLDGSADSAEVLPLARAVAKSTGARLELLSVTENLAKIVRSQMSALDDASTARSSVSYDHLEQIHEDQRVGAEAYLQGVVKELAGEGIAAALRIEDGDPAEAIVDTAGSSRGTLIAMCTHGRSGVTRWLLGSVTDKVVHHAGVPTLVIRGRHAGSDATASLNRVILPLDGSETSESAIPNAVELAASASASRSCGPSTWDSSRRRRSRIRASIPRPTRIALEKRQWNTASVRFHVALARRGGREREHTLGRAGQGYRQ